MKRRNLTPRQKKACRLLLSGYHISLVLWLDTNERDLCITDEEECNDYRIDGRTLRGLVARGIIKGRLYHSVVSPGPNMDHYQYTLHPDHVDYVKQQL